MGRTVYSKETRDAFIAPLSLRMGAAFIDYILLMLPPITALALGRLLGLDGSRLLNSGFTSAGWFLAAVIFFFNQILSPVLTGQTLGKKMLNLRIIDLDGRLPMLRAVLKRNLLGYALNVLTAGLGFVPALGRNGRGIHERISATTVIRTDGI